VTEDLNRGTDWPAALGRFFSKWFTPATFPDT
jgi:hypothetical protein